jgi:NDP-sugar pyrophosphorylase family protein
MKAMILAAGLGTRLRPLTDDRPKALVSVRGRTLLERTLTRLRSFGVNEVIVNAHHYAEKIAEYLNANGNFGMRIEISREETLLDTGGGLKKAAWFFLEDGARAEPFLVHNVDVLSSIDLGGMMRFHVQHNALATLAVQERATARYLLFDGPDRVLNGDELNDELIGELDGGPARLCGRRAGLDGVPELVRPAQRVEALAFSGIHVVSPRIFSLLDGEGAFSIIDAYLRLAARGEAILAFRADGAYWRDLGRPENLLAAEQDLARAESE